MNPIKFNRDGFIESEQFFLRTYYQYLKSMNLILDLPSHTMKRLNWKYDDIGLTNGCELSCLWCSKARPAYYGRCKAYLTLCKRYYNYLGA